MSTILFKAGPHDRRNCPVSFPLPAELDAKKNYALKCPCGNELPCQTCCGADGKTTLFTVIPDVPKGAEMQFEIVEAEAAKACVSVQNGAEADSYDVFVDDALFTTLHCGSQWAKPFMFPVLDANGACLTRAWPVIPDVPGETHDHPHQKSFWTAWGDMNGADGWGEDPKAGFATAPVHKVNILENGPLRVKIALELDHLAPNGAKIMSEHRVLTFMALGGTRAVDVDVTYDATDGDVTFGDTKEGGICSIRVASSMDGTAAGTITLADGSVGEAECWGKRSPWCDYSGPVGKGISGIAILDTPANFRFPTYWHVRNYGLMAANPFGLSHFYNDKSRNGSYKLSAGEKLRFQYRVLFHTGGSAGVGSMYHDYVHGPVFKA
ncbi:MAG: PmoA family protein [Victivallales bacterium]|nr:PmoA family protein [Victivallales bacterium]